MCPQKNNDNEQKKMLKRWKTKIKQDLAAVRDKESNHKKMNELYSCWREAQEKEQTIWGNVWKWSENTPKETKDKLEGDGSGYIPISQFKDWEKAFLDNKDLRNSMLSVFIPSYIVADGSKTEDQIWKDYLGQKQRILIISREGGLYSTGLAKPENLDIRIPCGALYEAYEIGALQPNNGEHIKKLVDDQVELLKDNLKTIFQPLAKKSSNTEENQKRSLNNAWLRKVLKGERESTSSGARAILLTAYLLKEKDINKRKSRALGLFEMLYPGLSDETLNDYDAAYEKVRKMKSKNPDKAKWATWISEQDWAKETGLSIKDQGSLFKKFREESLNNIAYMTVNKRGGASSQGKSQGKNVVKGYIDRYGDFLLEEISLFNPTAIVVYGKEIYDWLKENKESLRERFSDKKPDVKVYGFPHWAAHNDEFEKNKKGSPASYYYRINQCINRGKHKFDL